MNGKPLPNSVRQKIIEMAELGIRPCDISRQLKVSHGCISKLLSKYNDTGSFEPGRAKRKTSRDVSSEVKNKIEEYRQTAPGIFSWEVKEKLVADGMCTKESLPPLTVISRLLRRAKSTGSALEMSEAEPSDVESDTSSSNSGESTTAKPRPKRRSFSIANILSINEETKSVSEGPSSPPPSSPKEHGKPGLSKKRLIQSVIRRIRDIVRRDKRSECWPYLLRRKHALRCSPSSTGHIFQLAGRT